MNAADIWIDGYCAALHDAEDLLRDYPGVLLVLRVLLESKNDG